MRRSLSALLAACLVCALFPFGAAAAAAQSVTLHNAQGGELSGSGTSYTLTVRDGVTSVSFDMVFSGLSYSANPSFSVQVEENTDNLIERAIPIGGSLTGDGSRTLEFALSGDGAAQSTVNIVFRYGESGLSAPAAIAVRFVREPSGDAAPDTAPDTAAQSDGGQADEQPGGQEDDYTLITDPLNLPEVVISGNEARLTYRPRQLVSLGGDLPSISLTIHDISRLEPNTPLSLEEAGLDISLPASHVDAVLEAKADQLAESIDGIRLAEAGPAWTVDEAGERTVKELPDGMVRLEPVMGVELAEGTVLYFEDTVITVGEDGGFSLLVDEERLFEALLLDSSLELECRLAYRGLFSSKAVGLYVTVAGPSDFSSFGGEFGMDDISDEAFSEIMGGMDWDAAFGEVSFVGAQQVYQHGLYAQVFSGALAFTSSVPLGMTTHDEVRFDVPQEFSVQATRNDEEYQYLRGVPITQPGSYRFQFQAFGETEDGLATLYMTEFHFRILDVEVSDLPFYTPPQDFVVASVSIDERVVDNHPGTHFHLQRDGLYRIAIVNPEDPQQSHEVEFWRKTDAPALYLDGVIPGQSTRGAVQIHTADPNVHIDVWLDGQHISVLNNTVSESGFYSVLASDSAGNSAQYTFRILYTMNLSAWTSFALLFLLAGGVVVYGIWRRTHMKVR